MIVGFSIRDRKTNDQDNEGNEKNRTLFNHFLNTRFIKPFLLKNILQRKLNLNLLKLFRDYIIDNTYLAAKEA